MMTTPEAPQSWAGGIDQRALRAPWRKWTPCAADAGAHYKGRETKKILEGDDTFITLSSV